MTAPWSLRSRVTVASVVVISIVLVALSLTMVTAFNLAAKRSAAAILTDHMQLARQLGTAQTAPAVLVSRMETGSVRVRLVMDDGEILGNLRSPVGQSRSLTFPKADGVLAGARLTAEVDGRLLEGARNQLTWVLVLAAIGSIAISAVGAHVAMRYALSPLDAMTGLAQRIARGQRGQRIEPHDATTELGRTAVAFDEMLDALEGAERRALHAEDRMRQFIADAAHELRTPIAGIGAAAAAALQHGSAPGQQERLLLLLGREATRAGRMIDDLLDLARLDAGLQLIREPTHLRALVVAESDRLALHRPDVAIEIPDADAVADIDPGRISQVIANLLNNAARAMPSGGRILVSIDTTDDSVRLIVGDTGPGVAASDRERIFDRMVRLPSAESPAEGSGLGLPIARGIARAHGGDLTCVEPPPGMPGAWFVLELKMT